MFISRRVAHRIRHEITSPILAPRGLAEFAARRPDATVKESSVAFPSTGIARISVVYSVPGNAKPRTQLIEFVYGKETWNVFWMPEAAK